MYLIKAAIERVAETDSGEIWRFGINAVDYTGNGKGKRISPLLPYVCDCRVYGRAEAVDCLKTVLNNNHKPLLDLTGRKFKRTKTEIKNNTSYYEWQEIV